MTKLRVRDVIQGALDMVIGVHMMYNTAIVGTNK
jgi:hypothetical protein